ncbi:hypothetical protein OFY01_19875 [Streptomyces sp. GXMU-J5]|uniref:Uncharacterized protein n=1 Tax=Streptomyces beihaiensis TaxID=2984495 RepID=A0ABT3TY95_9ACTN|nr:hypothetical protein [Streptomyces beihaiensis]MCX3061979.1 hypothetical protein [Streptomyces beihaiensis]
MKITFLLFDAYGIGGTIRATANLATALAERHHVEIVSYHRTAERMAVPVDPRVRVRDLVDLRRDAHEDPVSQTLDAVCPYDPVYASRTPPSALGEQRLAHFLRRTDSDVVIATRPCLVCFLAEHGRADAYRRIGREHLTRASHSDALLRDLDAALDALDAFVTLSEGDALAYDRALPVRQALITHIPGCCPQPEVEAATGTSRIVVAAGRLVPVKRHDRLIGAFAKAAARHRTGPCTSTAAARSRPHCAVVSTNSARTPMCSSWALALASTPSGPRVPSPPCPATQRRSACSSSRPCAWASRSSRPTATTAPGRSSATAGTVSSSRRTRGAAPCGTSI